MKKLLLSLTVVCGILNSYAQDYFPKNDGVNTTDSNYTVFKNATIHTSPDSEIKNGTLVIQKGKIVQVGNTVTIPANSIIIDLQGKHIYASFIDPYTNFGIEKPKSKGESPFRGNPQYEASRAGYYWNDHIRPETNALTHFKYDAKKATEYIQQGFGVLHTHMPDGIVRGTGLLVALNNKGTEGERLLSDRSAQFLSFSKSNKSKQLYPTSLMGAIALLRQMYYDANWYTTGNADNKDLSLEALLRNKNLPQIFEAGSRINGFRADKIGDQFNTQYVIVGGGDEYAKIDKVKATNAKYIIPLDFPEAYDVSDPFATNSVSLGDMRHWNQAPTNPAVLSKNGISFSLTTHKLKKIGELNSRIEKAIQHGLDKKTAIAALTTIPAQILGKSDLLGSLKKGSYANFLITKKELFSKDNILYENWVQGHKNIINDRTTTDINGAYELTVAGTTYDVSISGKTSTPKAVIKLGETKLGTKISRTEDWVHLTFTDPDTTKTQYTRIVSQVNNTATLWSGKAILPNGSETSFSIQKKPKDDSAKNSKEKPKKPEEKPEIFPITYPNIAYGNTQLPKPETILFKNATVWTNEADGILTETDVLIKDGKISAVGKNLSSTNAKVIDATGKHITAGIIDEHSHIAAAAINEAGHNSSAEVTIEDVVSPDDINIYRNLAGGVTSIQILHGSANPIGGRSAIIKLKWGQDADNLIFPNSPKFIKFALGENVKQSNWQSFSRFPQSRMGVEQLYMDYFSRAKEYEKLKNSGKSYRKDTEMETLVEILNGERYISCHSYVQSEINMLMKVAEKFNFKINTFTHILEGYKVADKMAAHGVGGSTFSDWWAYKYEVNDAIPYNASIMHNQGVVTAINSDDAEMARRLNQEAAKSVKYGGVSEEDALKFVTLNPAKLLHIDNRVGSIKVGKDADVVLWTDHPLSIYAKAEKTIIEGAVYFDIEKDKVMRKSIAAEKNKLSALLLKAKNSGLKTQPAKKKEKQHFECETLETIN
ncbi:amidohydrolase family protein [Aquimarina muelleri]|uniref:Periplasmic amidohydrolase n=1 Tax=Aquimarina muelleri TaxID=279356 RepID=A0A918JUI0_9FLAO|nr:amidohydrolase family protein [Aquimarina muelleri]MCX2763898.1 amidohydrolase family protein [Aquimarina muelleri]GGX10993.1 periplasmic amidohydrolase [Aquimarina muelleri]